MKATKQHSLGIVPTVPGGEFNFLFTVELYYSYPKWIFLTRNCTLATIEDLVRLLITYCINLRTLAMVSVVGDACWQGSPVRNVRTTLHLCILCIIHTAARLDAHRFSGSAT